ncbi:MAG: DUF790 family protein [Planctomycetes bacterium]|nr:DUF790 family protein [Planctomycetota bacterium]
MLPERDLAFSPVQGRAVPHYLGPEDEPWLRSLMDEVRRFEGRPGAELDERLASPLPHAAPDDRRRMAIRVLARFARGACRAAVQPRRARAFVFAERAVRAGAREDVLLAAARRLGVEPEAVEESLFADLPGERRVSALPNDLSTKELAARTNLLLVQSLLFRATSVRIEAEGNARPVVRHAKLRGLIVTVAEREDQGDAALEISGPFALFRRTLLYGRALAGLVPVLAWCDRFRLRARCVLGNREHVLHVQSGDPVFPAPEPIRYDSRLERRFAKDFLALAPDWDLVREPEAVRAGGALVFPDFALVHRRDPGRRRLLEIVGFWTPAYLAEKLARLREARIPNLILAVDEERNCAEEDFPPDARVVRFRGRVDAAAILAAIEELPVQIERDDVRVVNRVERIMKP